MDAAGVLFDVDGTLVDTTFVNAVCWAEALRQQGRPVATRETRDAIGMSGDRLLDRVAPGLDDPQAAADAHLTLYRQWWGRLVPLPGAADLLRECAKRGLDVVLASSATDEELAALTSAIDADDAITTATSSADAESGKPAPDILQAALDQSGLAADDVVFVGDAVWDGASARRAAVRYVAVTCGGTPADELREAGAIEVWKDPAELLANFDDSLLGKL